MNTLESHDVIAETGLGAAPEPVGKGARAIRTDEKRMRIIQLAAPLFLENGYASVSINDIIAVVGGSKGTIYSNFGSKEGLFEAVVKQICSDVMIHIDTTKTGTVEEQLIRLGRSFLGIILTPPVLQLHRLMTSIGRTFPQAGQMFFEAGPLAAYKIIAAWISYHQAHGTIRTDADAFRLAVLFHDMLIGEQQMMWLTSRAGADSDAAVEATLHLAVRVFLAGCQQPAG